MQLAFADLHDRNVTVGPGQEMSVDDEFAENRPQEAEELRLAAHAEHVRRQTGNDHILQRIVSIGQASDVDDR